MAKIAKPTMKDLLKKVWIKPDPLQPEDTSDEMISVAVTLDGLALMYGAFQCAHCQTKYSREVNLFGLGPVQWFPNPHQCVQTEAEQGA